MWNAKIGFFREIWTAKRKKASRDKGTDTHLKEKEIEQQNEKYMTFPFFRKIWTAKGESG